MIRKLLRCLKLHPKSIILITIPDAGNLICDKRSTELFILMIVIGFLFPLERFNSRAQMVACGNFFSSLPIQKLSIVVDKCRGFPVSLNIRDVAFASLYRSDHDKILGSKALKLSSLLSH